MVVSADLTVRVLMTTDPARVAPEQPVQAALNLMNARRVGAVLVADTADKLLGIFTERDFLRQVGSASGYPVTRPFLERMHRHWF